MKLSAGILAATLLSGCSMVYVNRPIGDTPENIQAKADEWNGSWMGPDGAPFVVGVADGTNGVLKVSYVDEKEDGFTLNSYLVYLRHIDQDWMIASILPQDETNTTRHLWCRIKKDERMAILWAPDANKIEALVETGALSGTVTNTAYSTTVSLRELTAKQINLIRSETNGVVFMWDKPMVFLKLSK